MFQLVRTSLNVSLCPRISLVRHIALSSVLNLKRIEKSEDKNTNTITIEGKYIDSKEIFGSNILNLNDQNADDIRPCAFCELEKRDIKVQYTDVLVLRQFLTENGQILPRKVTGLCKKQHKKLIVLAKQAKHAGLILNLQPTLLDGSRPSPDHSKRLKYLKWNTYFDDYETMKRTKKFL